MTTLDSLFAGALHLCQPARGHRAGTDAVLLAAACPAGARQIVDLGCGVGTVGLRAAQCHPAAEIALIDSDPAILALARENIARNGLEARVRAVEADCLLPVFPRPETGLRSTADVVLTNPPFFGAMRGQGVRGQVMRGQVSPVALKARAHVFEGPLADATDGWIKGALRCLGPRGHIVVIHRADALPGLLAALDRRFGDVRLRFVHAKAEAPAIRVLIRATLGSRAALRVLPPLVLQHADGTFTAQSAAIHEGVATLDWD